ncbi:efflux RND transporter periplasmic adaptor subunit [Marinobacter salexigens]|uniref:efflux RND transporter periplasmic adaptor subunit n=1 Tax=Marinobacter salexigens TaxID=1925763 RepID=UPI000C291FC2|nr:efflux RND transporter periplasmic adaptor subunit [Marinobacter salexigens]
MFSFSCSSPLRLILWVSLTVCTLLMVTGCSEPAAPLSSPPVPVSVVKLEATEVRPSRDFVARTAASARADLTARIEAEIKQILFVEGAKVERGQVLVQLEDTRVAADLQRSKAELTAARAELDSARRNLTRGEDVASKGYLSDADLDKLKDRFNMAQSRLETAEAAVQIAQTNVDYAVIRAPFDGWIGRQNYDEGAIVSPASGAIADVLVTDPIYVEFQLDESDYVAFRRAAQGRNEDVTNGLSLSLTLPDGGRFDQDGQLNFTDVETDARTGTVAMRAVFSNSDAVLLPGLFVTLKIEGATGAAQVLVPQAAIQETIEGKFVLVVDDQNKVVQRFVKTGARLGAMLAIESGLEAGEQVIVEGLQKVRSGIEVKPIIKAINPKTGVFSEAESSDNGAS